MELDAYQRLLAEQDRHKARKRPTHEESRIQQHCFRAFNYLYPEYRGLYFSVPNGAHTKKTEAAILKAEGLTAGVADTFLAVPSGRWHGLFIEYKKEALEYDEKTGKLHKSKTYQEKEQKEWQKLVEAQGYRYEIVRNFEEFNDLIKEYLKDERADEHKDSHGCKDNHP